MADHIQCRWFETVRVKKEKKIKYQSEKFNNGTCKWLYRGWCKNVIQSLSSTRHTLFESSSPITVWPSLK